MPCLPVSLGTKRGNDRHEVGLSVRRRSVRRVLARFRIRNRPGTGGSPSSAPVPPITGEVDRVVVVRADVLVVIVSSSSVSVASRRSRPHRRAGGSRRSSPSRRRTPATEKVERRFAADVEGGFFSCSSVSESVIRSKVSGPRSRIATKLSTSRPARALRRCRPQPSVRRQPELRWDRPMGTLECRSATAARRTIAT